MEKRRFVLAKDRKHDVFLNPLTNFWALASGLHLLLDLLLSHLAFVSGVLGV